MVKIGFRIEQPIDMVNSQSRDLAFFNKSQDERMYRVKNSLAFCAESDQVADVEEPAVIDAVRGFAPVGEPVMLSRKNSVKGFHAVALRSSCDRQLLIEIPKNG